MTEKEKTLDLATLEWIKLNFGLFSDHSCQTQGYRSLCRIIDELRGVGSLANQPQKAQPSEYNSFNPNIRIKYSSSDPNCPICHGSGEYYTGGSFGGPVVYNRCRCTNRSWEL